jgi:outer membrane receptor protein involved in Fe transport
MQFGDELVKSGQVDIFGQPITGNAKKTRHIGLEIEGALRFSPVLTLSANLTASRNRIVASSYFPGAGAPVPLDGNPIAGFPDVLGNIRLTARSGSVTASLIGKYVGAFHTDNLNDESNTTDAAVVFNGELLYRFPSFAGTALTLRGEVRNIFNVLYLAGGEGNTFFPAAERNFLIGLSVHL